ncbi:MAG: GNAT family N-acetyltransferase [Candidatus Promineifilaceae bacterium]
MRTTIRRVTEVEVKSLIDIRLEALQNHPVAFSADYEKELKRPIPEWRKRIGEGAIFIAWDGNSEAGMAGFIGGWSNKTSHHGSIWGVYVRPAYRGQGLGDRLVMRCLQHARDEDFKMVYIAAASSNTAAIRCYARCGFSVYGLQPMAVCVDGEYYDELLMAQRL